MALHLISLRWTVGFTTYTTTSWYCTVLANGAVRGDRISTAFWDSRSTPPRGPLGFVLWIDNQYAVASLEGRFGFGVLPLPETQWLEVDGLVIEPA